MGFSFVESPKRPSKLIFVVLNFVAATSPGAWHCCTSDDVTKVYQQRLDYVCLWPRPSSWTRIIPYHTGINFRGWENFVTASQPRK